MTLGQRFLALRTQAGLSQEALAEQLGVSRQSVSRWETDTSIPDLHKLVQLGELFGVTLDELVKGEAAPEAASPESPLPASLLHRGQAFYRRNAYLLGWLLAGSGLWDAVRQIQVLLSFAEHAPAVSAAQWANVELGTYLFTALKLLAGLAVVFLGRRFAGGFRWHHLGWVLILMGLFGVPTCIPALRFGPLESLLTALLVHLRFYGPEKALELLSLWYSSLWNFILCALGLVILLLGSQKAGTSKSEL